MRGELGGAVGTLLDPSYLGTRFPLDILEKGVEERREEIVEGKGFGMIPGASGIPGNVIRIASMLENMGSSLLFVQLFLGLRTMAILAFMIANGFGVSSVCFSG
jgi:hypothetical protein